jgi:hypothetical protein
VGHRLEGVGGQGGVFVRGYLGLIGQVFVHELLLHT